MSADASGTPEPQSLPRRSSPSPDRFRWQTFFQRADDPLFLLNRRQRLLFVNRAWEALTGLTASQALGLICRRTEPASPSHSMEEVLAHVLCPPPEVLSGSAVCARRLLPGREATRRLWDVDFLPLRAGGHALTILGRIHPLPVEEPAPAVPLPERLIALRQRVAARSSLELWPIELPALRRLAEQARLAAEVTAPVLLFGEAGTGKETLARIIHHLGRGRERAFVSLHCGLLPPASLAHVLFESGLTAPQGPLASVYLREPACLPRELQARLCALLKARSSESGARILAGSSTDPAEDVRSGRLLEELSHALSTLVLHLPPLRERKADLPWLVECVLDRGNSEGGRAIVGVSADALEVINAHSWPGNLRELCAVLDSARDHAEGDRITLSDLPAYLRTSVRLEQTPGRPAERSLSLDQILEQVERRLIERALRRCDGNRARAAALLGIWRPRLLRRLEALGLAGEAGSEEAQT
jgi:transcriptional regulator with PAS, ATPase and Fis domain